MNKTIVGIIACAFMLLGVGNSYAGLFAKGGGESRTINSVSPASVFNATRQTVTLSGRFSKKQGRNRRVVLSMDRLPTPRPLRVYEWKRDRITVAISAAEQPDRYHIYLERDFGHHGQHQWRVISNKMAFEIMNGSHVRRDGLPHAAPIRVRNIDSVCGGPRLQVRISGGPFQRDGNPINGIRAEVRTALSPPNRMIAPTIRIVSNIELIASVVRCQVLHNGAQIRLIYPDRSESDWVSIHQTVGNSAGGQGRLRL